MRRLLLSFVSYTVLLLVAAPAALAEYNDGRGFYGATDDKAITNIAFATLAFFVVFVFLASMIQGRLQKRKYARMAAAKARKNDSAWDGHW